MLKTLTETWDQLDGLTRLLFVVLMIIVVGAVFVVSWLLGG